MTRGAYEASTAKCLMDLIIESEANVEIDYRKTVHHLLEHTSGIPRIFTLPNFQDVSRREMTAAEKAIENMNCLAPTLPVDKNDSGLCIRHSEDLMTCKILA